jgi:hypothetical protein
MIEQYKNAAFANAYGDGERVKRADGILVKFDLKASETKINAAIDNETGKLIGSVTLSLNANALESDSSLALVL